MTFKSLLSVMLSLLLEVVLCDVDSSSGLMLIDDLVEKSKECIILIIDYPIGNYNDVEILNKLEIPIIEDISCSIGTFTENFRPGSLGKYVLVGLEENHLITAGGGAVVVAHSRSDVTNLKKSYDLMDKTVLLPDMNSALAIVQSSSLSSRLEKRQLYFELFFSQLQKGGHKTLVLGYEIESLLYSFPVLIDVGLRDVVAYSKKKGVMTKISFENIALDKIDPEGHEFPNALSIKLRTLLFPLYSLLGNKNSDLISRVLLTLP